ncbi:coiled-coil domain-containing protein 173-like [Anguilla anguilla]|uniref:coiled-coil domain-containing protein 173-like n=1 Tax=Anguilla anguilla TaxID=7936 RepID=UPI0015A9BB55|nr:coiled-coil domain-containing protein 173-like [Anguilla anguilla]
MNIAASGENRDSRRGLQGHRQEARQKAIRQEFYQSDRVRQFHRALLQSETLNDRENQAKTDQKLTSAANEETKKMIDEIKRKWLEGIEQDRQHLRKREMEAKAVGDYIKQQMMEHESMRRQMMLEKEREIEECRQMREQYARETQMRKQQDHIDKMKARKAHRDLLAATSTIRALEAEKQEMEAERRRFFEMERDKRVMRKQEKREERRRVAQRYKKMVVEQLATEMREKASEEEQLNAKILADSIAKWEAKLHAEQTEMEEKNKSMQDAIAAHRELTLKEQEQKAKEDEENAQEELSDRKEDDRMHWETEELKAQEKENERAAMDDFLRRQVLGRRFRDRLLRGEQLDFDKKYEELISEEEEQFQQYTAAVIDAATNANRNIIPLLRAANHGMWCGLGPINGGLRTGYLVPGANYDQIPDYVGTTAADIKRLYENDQADSRRLGFIW